jgi:F-type H+-transporting ATPase subunit gamma
LTCSATRALVSLYPDHCSLIYCRLNGFLLDTATSTEAARMSAMENSTNNANELIDHLSITYNKARQAKITGELIEIISGAEAV